MKKIFIYFLLACSLSLFHCGGIDEGADILGQLSGAANAPSSNGEPEEPQDRRIAEGTTPSDTVPTEDPDPSIERRSLESSGAESIVTLQESEGTDEIEEYPVNLPLTYLCIKNQTVFSFYLYKPGMVGQLCDLHYSGHSEFWYADHVSDFCEKKLVEGLEEKIQEGYTCYCGRPGGPSGIVKLTDRGHECRN